MVKKKVSGQTIAIIILAALLLIAIAFGGVYAFYSARSNKAVTGKIYMANLKIALNGNTSESAQSEIIIYNKELIVPGQTLDNSPLVINNLSTVDIYLIVVYQINADAKRDIDGDGVLEAVKVPDDYYNPVIGLGCEYYNSLHPETNITESDDDVTNEDWYDYVFNAEEEGRYYRCLVSKQSVATKDKGNDVITVIGENELALHKKMGEEYEDSVISFTFQAYAIGASTDFDFAETDTKAERCEKIVSMIYESQDHKFFNELLD